MSHPLRTRMMFALQKWLLCVFSLFLVLQGAESFAPHDVPHRTRSTVTTTTTTQLYGVGQFFSKLLGRDQRQQQQQQLVVDHVHQALLGRRTVNNFDPHRTVDPAIVDQAVHAAIYAPNHKMTEPWRFIFLGNQTITAIATLNAATISQKDAAKGETKRQRWQAIPGWCVVTCAKSPSDPVQEREDYAATSCAIQNFMLSLWSHNVGTKWTSGPITRTTEFADLCGIDPAKELVVGCLWYGHADGLQAIPAPRRKQSVDQVTSTRP